MSRSPTLGDAAVYYGADYASSEFARETRRARGWGKLVPFILLVSSEAVKARVNDEVNPKFTSAFGTRPSQERQRRRRSKRTRGEA